MEIFYGQHSSVAWCLAFRRRPTGRPKRKRYTSGLRKNGDAQSESKTSRHRNIKWPDCCKISRPGAFGQLRMRNKHACRCESKSLPPRQVLPCQQRSKIQLSCTWRDSCLITTASCRRDTAKIRLRALWRKTCKIVSSEVYGQKALFRVFNGQLMLR